MQMVSSCVKYDKDTNWVRQFGPTKGRFKRGAMIVSNSTDGMSSISARLKFDVRSNVAPIVRSAPSVFRADPRKTPYKL